MGLFKSKQEKEMEQRMIVKKTIRSIEKYLAKLQEQKVKALEAAKRAKLEGSTQQYSLALSGLRTAMAQEKKAKEMLLNFELTLQMRDLSKMTSEFLNGMSLMSKEMTAITKDMDFAKVQKQFEEAMIGVEQTTDNIDAMLDATNDSFFAISSAHGKIDDAELERLINNQLSDGDANVDKEIDAKMSELKKMLKE